MTPGAAISGLRAAAYEVPTETPEADGTLSWTHTTVVVVRVRVGAVEGTGWTYAHPSCARLAETTLASAISGVDVLDVPAAWQAMQHAIRNLGRPGLVSCAMSAVEIALWDAAARLLGLPLSRLLGRVRENVAVYGSGGFTNASTDALRDQLRDWTGVRGLPAVKIKIGESWGHATARDLARVRLARAEIGEDVDLHVDANGAYSVGQAVRVGVELDALGVCWFEEPVSSDDLAGLAHVRRACRADVTAGEYGYHLPHFAGLLRAEAVDCLQIDVTRCGGFGEWQRAAALAAAENIEVSGHCAPNLAAHVAVATPNVRHLEWFHDHERVDRLLFDGVLDPTGGSVHPSATVPGHGMTLKEVDAEPYRVARQPVTGR